MSALLQAELIKLRTTRTFVALALIAVATSLLFTVLSSTLTEPSQDSVLTDVFLSDTSSLFIMILAIVGISGEWRHRTITSSLLAAPHRLRFLAAKVLAFAIAGMALSVIVSIAVTITGVTILEARGLPTPGAGELLSLYARNALVAALLAAFGVGIGALVRNQVIAIVGILLFALAVEPALIALAPDVGRFTPISGLPTAITNVDPDAVGVGGLDVLDPVPALLAMLAWIGALYAAGGALLQRRDLE
jgi:ABC-2 type transport system permease protein